MAPIVSRRPLIETAQIVERHADLLGRGAAAADRIAALLGTPATAPLVAALSRASSAGLADVLQNTPARGRDTAVTPVLVEAFRRMAGLSPSGVADTSTSTSPLRERVARAAMEGGAGPDVRAAAADAMVRAYVASATGPAPEVLRGPADLLTSPTSALTWADEMSLALHAEDSSVAPQIVQAIRMQAARGGGDAQIRLEPQFLGGVSVSIRVDQGGVSASLAAEAPMVREWLHANEALLRQGLTDQGLRLDRLQITAPPADARHEESAPDRRDQPRDRRAPRRPPQGESSEPFTFLA